MGDWLQRDFFQRDPVTCARELIGCKLVLGACTGTIVETEAYHAVGDEACHTFHRPSARAFVASHTAGAAYVYFNYGMYWLLNVLVKGPGDEGFVLLRALQPGKGIEEMKTRRGVGRRSPLTDARQLCSGPGKLAVALGVTGADHGRDLCTGASVGFRRGTAPVEIVCDGRIGISKAQDLPWRFTLRGSEYVSIRPKLA